MKKVLSILAVFVFMATLSFGQSTTTRWGTHPFHDNTYRIATFHAYQVPDSTLGDSISVIPTTYMNLYTDSITTWNGSIKFGVPVNTQAYLGDKMEILVTGASGNTVTFSTVAGWKAATATLSTKGRADICFTFDGLYWVEKSVYVQ